MRPEDLQCWKCGAPLADVLLPFSRTAKCKSCNVDLHVCCMCKFYDTSKSNACNEPLAEKVNDKKRKNFCGYFQPDENAFKAGDPGKVKSSKTELDTLFGLGSEARDKSVAENDHQKKLNELFGLNRGEEEG